MRVDIDKNKIHAFTLLEVMMSVAIVGFLAAVAIPSFEKYVYEAKTTESVIFVDAIKKAQQSYFIENNEFMTLEATPALPRGAGGSAATSTVFNHFTLQRLGTPIPIGLNSNYRYQVTVGHTDASGDDVTSSWPNGKRKQFARNETIAMGLGGISSNSCDLISSLTSQGTNGLTNPLPANFSWAAIHAYANFHASGRPSENCSHTFMFLNYQNGAFQTSPVIKLAEDTSIDIESGTSGSSSSGSGDSDASSSGEGDASGDSGDSEGAEDSGDSEDGRDSGDSEGAEDSGDSEDGRDSGDSEGAEDSGDSEDGRDSGDSEGAEDSGDSRR